MSERDRIRMTDEEVAAFLAAKNRVHVATLGTDGTPHLVPIHYVLLDGDIAFWTDAGSQKVVDIRRDPRVTCLVEDGAEFQELRGVQVRGRAEVSEDADISLRIAELFLEKVPDPEPGVGDYLRALALARVVVVVKASRTISWDHRKMAGVRPQDVGK